ncbi:MAG: lamin tail domain-containing protein, partial [Anaerolineae bacterium]
MRIPRNLVRLFPLVIVMALLPLAGVTPNAERVRAAPLANSLRISQVYGGGGNSGATYQCDFVELFNASTSTVAISNWSIQYAPSGSAFSFAGAITSASIPAGGYYLIQMYCPASPAGSPLPTPDLTLSMSASGGMSASPGKVALVSNTTQLTCGGSAGNCFPNADIVDFVGYGSANNYEGSSAAPGPSNNTTSVLRGTSGCTDTDQNGSDLATGSVNPRNSSSSTYSCSVAILVVTKSASESSVSAGDSYNYTIEIENVGSSAASGVTVSDDFDETKLDFLNSSPATSSFNSSTQAATWSIGALAAGASTTINVEVNTLGGASGTVNNAATATGAGLGVSTSNTAAVSIVAIPTPSITTNGSKTCGTAGGVNAEGPGFCDAATGPGAESILLSMSPCRAAGKMCFMVDVQANESLTIHSNGTTAAGNLTTTPYYQGAAGSSTNQGDVTGVKDTSIAVPASGVDQYQVCFAGTGGEVRDLYVKFATPSGATGRIHSDAWCMSNKTFCPTCKFDFTVLARCGEKLRLPFDDFENMTGLKIFKPGAGGAPSTTTLAAVSVHRVQGATDCTYWSHAGGDPSSTSGTYDGSYCGKSIPAVNSDNDTVTWYDGDALNLSNVITNEEYWGDACYTDPPPDPTVSKGYCAGGGLCESASPGDSNYNSQAQIYLEIDLSAAANGCGAYTLQSDRATGYNWSLQSFCYDGSTQLGAQQVYFNGATQCSGGNAPGLAATSALPELVIDTTLEILANGAVNPAACSGGVVDAPITVSYNLANPSCGAATGPFSNAFTISDADAANSATHSSVATLAAYAQRTETVNTTVQCACSGSLLTGGALQVTSTTLDSASSLTECSENSNAVNCLPTTSVTQSPAASCLSLWNAAGSPLAAALAGFDAAQAGDAILVSWETVSEVGNIGFNLWRGTSPSAPDAQLNASLIPSQAPGSSQGFSYEWLDAVNLVNTTTYYYWLEDVDIAGLVTRHGPISATY